MQQVNLYVPELRPKKEWLTATTLIYLTGGLCFLLAVSVVLNMNQLKRFEEKVIALENQRAFSERRLTEIKGRSPKDVANKLDAEIDLLRGRIKQRIQISELIGSQNLGNELGYAERFNALARSTPNSISITQFAFDDGEKSVHLRGLTKAPEDIASFIASVGSTQSYASAKFGALSVTDGKKSDGTYHFAFGFLPVFIPDDRFATADMKEVER